MAIKLDISAHSIVVYCEDCGHWRAFAWTIVEGHEAAVRHEQNVHPNERQAFYAQHKYLARLAAADRIVHTPADDRSHGDSRLVRRR